MDEEVGPLPPTGTEVKQGECSTRVRTYPSSRLCPGTECGVIGVGSRVTNRHPESKHKSCLYLLNLLIEVTKCVFLCLGLSVSLDRYSVSVTLFLDSGLRSRGLWVGTRESAVGLTHTLQTFSEVRRNSERIKTECK